MDNADLEERVISKEERDKHPDSDFAGKNRSFPIFTPEDVAAAAASLGRAGPDNYSTEQIKANIIRIAKRKGAAFVAKLPAAWKESQMADDLDGGLIPLTERAVAPDGTIAMRLIAPGWGASGYYPKEVLERDGPKVWPAGTHMYLDHPTESELKERPERSVRDLAAVTISDPVYEEKGKAGPGLYARASVLPQWRETIEALAPYIGVSIRASGSYESGEAEGKQGKVITSLVKGHSVDFVTKPGAGGKVLAIMESLRQGDVPQSEAENVVSTQASMDSTESGSDYVTTTTTTGTGDCTPTIHLYPTAPVSESDQREADEMELREAQERIAALEKDLEDAKTTAKEATERAERAEGALAILEAQGVAREALENVSLPAAAKMRIVAKVTADPPLGEDGKLDREKLSEAVAVEAKAEAEYIESITSAGKVTDQGAEPVTESDSKDRLSKSLSSFFRLDPEAAKRAVNGR